MAFQVVPELKFQALLEGGGVVAAVHEETT